MPSDTSPESTGSSGSIPETRSETPSATETLPELAPVVMLEELVEVDDVFWNKLFALVKEGPRVGYHVTWISTDVHRSEFLDGNSPEILVHEDDFPN